MADSDASYRNASETIDMLRGSNNDDSKRITKSAVVTV
jgi:hypothetical protein